MGIRTTVLSPVTNAHKYRHGHSVWVGGFVKLSSEQHLICGNLNSWIVALGRRHRICYRSCAGSRTYRGRAADRDAPMVQREIGGVGGSEGIKGGHGSLMPALSRHSLSVLCRPPSRLSSNSPT